MQATFYRFLNLLFYLFIYSFTTVTDPRYSSHNLLFYRLTGLGFPQPGCFLSSEDACKIKRQNQNPWGIRNCKRVFTPFFSNLLFFHYRNV